MEIIKKFLKFYCGQSELVEDCRSYFAQRNIKLKSLAKRDKNPLKIFQSINKAFSHHYFAQLCIKIKLNIK